VNECVAFAYAGLASRDLEHPVDELTREGFAVTFVGFEPGPVTGFDPLRTFRVERAFEAIDAARLVIVPGGFAWRRLAATARVVSWLQRLAGGDSYVLGISTGALVVAAAGLLPDRPATGHWLALDDLAALGARSTDDPVVRAGRIFTVGGGLPAVEAIRLIVEEWRWAPPPEPGPRRGTRDAGR
jgi:putative intracellular protease/amidase